MILAMTKKAQETKAKISMWDYMKLKHLYNLKKNEVVAYRIGETFANHTSDIKLMSKIHKEF